MRLINPDELAANLIAEYGDDRNEITQQWLKTIDKEIDECNDYSKAINHKLFAIGEILVDNSKSHYSDKVAIEKIRKVLQEY